MLDFLCRRNEYGEPQFAETQWHTGCRPIGYHSLTAFLNRRKAPKHRKHIRELLEQYGCDDLEGFLQVTHALSLNDTFWVREAGSSLTWAEVSLYTNEFSENISQAAFDGILLFMELPLSRSASRCRSIWHPSWRQSYVRAQSFMTWPSTMESSSASAHCSPVSAWDWPKPARFLAVWKRPFRNCCDSSLKLAQKTLFGGCACWTPSF